MFRPSLVRIAMYFPAALAAMSLIAMAAPCRAQSEIKVATSADAEHAIRTALERTMSFEFTDTPLKDVAAAFERSVGVPIARDTTVLAAAGITPDTPISFSESNISARMALDSMLAAHDLSWIVQRDLLIITTADVAKSYVVIRVYPVADLVFIESADAYDADFDSLIEVITSTLVAASWDSNGGAGSLAPFVPSGALVVSQTREVHEKIESLLTRLREVRDVQGLRTALKIVGSKAEPGYGGAFSVGETMAEENVPPPARPMVARSNWHIPRVYR